MYAFGFAASIPGIILLKLWKLLHGSQTATGGEDLLAHSQLTSRLCSCLHVCLVLGPELASRINWLRTMMLLMPS